MCIRDSSRPEHPYTQKLFLAAPIPDPDRQEERREDRRRLAEQLAEAGA